MTSDPGAPPRPTARMARPAARGPIVAAVAALLVALLLPDLALAARLRDADAGRWIVAVARTGGSAIGPRGLVGPLPRSRRLPGDARAARQVRRILRASSIRPDVRFRNAFDGFAGRLTTAQLAAVRRDRAVAVLIPDTPTRVDAGTGGGSGGPASSLVRRVRLRKAVTPTGIRRVQADSGPLSRIDGRDDRPDVDVAVIDTGIAPSSDLRIAGGYNCTGDAPAWRDREGHGTHVAGTIAARDDRKGVVGVVPGARLWAIKIFDDQGAGFLSEELCGLDHVLGMRDPDDASRPRIEAINLSIGQWLTARDDRDCGRPAGDLVHGAICALVADGTTVVVAAGNQSVSTQGRQPAAYDEALTVSALADFDGKPGGKGRQADICPWYSADQDDTFGDFSNFGPDVDLIAPGKCILSTLPNGFYGWSTGTSMATPHVTGAVALLAARFPGATPGQIRAALIAAATKDWRTRTDPDGVPDPLLDLSRVRALPGFAVEAGGPSDELARGGLTFLPVSLSRTGGHTARIAVTVPDLPDGVTADVAPSPTKKSALTVTLRAGGAAPAGPLEVTIRATDGDLVRTTTAGVTIRAAGPTVDFSEPSGGDPWLTGGDNASVAFTEDDPGDPPAERRVLRQVGKPVTPGTCEGVDWSADGDPADPATLDPGGSAATGWAFQAPIGGERCTRWLVRLIDGDGGSARFASPAVLRDTTDPGVPTVRATGEGVLQAGQTVWVRAGSGTVTFSAAGRDAGAGVASHRFGPLSDPTGWSGPGDGVTVPGDPSTLELTWGPDAVETALDISARDALDRTGTGRTMTLKVDASAPKVAGWVYPKSRSFDRTGFVPELLWKPVTDRGSGPADLQSVQRQVARPHGGSCRGADWRDDGPPRLAAQHDEQWTIVSARCYRWILTPLDRVGNAGTPITSGILLVDLLAPTADFLSPDEGSTVTVRPGSYKVRWTERDQPNRGHVYRWLERERVRIKDGACPTLGWTFAGGKDSGSSPSVQRLEAGWCYRWRLNLSDVWVNLGAELSGVVKVQR